MTESTNASVTLLRATAKRLRTEAGRLDEQANHLRSELAEVEASAAAHRVDADQMEATASDIQKRELTITLNIDSGKLRSAIAEEIERARADPYTGGRA